MDSYRSSDSSISSGSKHGQNRVHNIKLIIPKGTQTGRQTVT